MKGQLRVISMVPSWTETLIACGVQVVGRTRFCIHPKDKVKEIPAVGGTKDINWSKVKELSPDLIVLDEEENPRKMAEECPFPWIATHIDSVSSVQNGLELLSQRLENAALKDLALRWGKISPAKLKHLGLENLPGIMEWTRPLKPSVNQFIYLIWNKPWMAISPKTFIGSVLSTLGYGQAMVSFDEKYPEVKLEDYDPEKTLLLFSTEPYPFFKRKDLILAQPFSSAIIDGEVYSWFGVRSLEFLEKSLSVRK